jgi:hypothetical protein
LKSSELLEAFQIFYSCIGRCNPHASKSLLFIWKAMNSLVLTSKHSFATAWGSEHSLTYKLTKTYIYTYKHKTQNNQKHKTGNSCGLFQTRKTLATQTWIHETCEMQLKRNAPGSLSCFPLPVRCDSFTSEVSWIDGSFHPI